MEYEKKRRKRDRLSELRRCMNASAVTPVCVVSQVQVCHGSPKTPGPRIANKLCFKLDSAPKLSRRQTAHAPAVSYACGFRFEAWPGCTRVECVAELADDGDRKSVV